MRFKLQKAANQEGNMKKSLKVNMILMEFIFLVIVVGGSVFFYSVFAPGYYRRQKAKVIEKAYAEIKMMDMVNLQGEDLEVFKSYEAENLTFTIADESLKPIYTTSKSSSVQAQQVHRNIVVNKGLFSKNPEVLYWTARGNESLRLLGKFNQDKVKYYVCIKENVQKVYSALFYTKKILIFVVVMSLVAGCVFMYMQSRRIAKPIEDIARVSQKIAERDFSVRAKEYNNYQEINSLAHNFNTMTDQLQYYIQELEDRKDSLEQFNKMRNDFTANVSHELKTPLAVISSQIELLQTMGDKIDREYYFQSIREEVQKMSDMVGDLLNISSLEHKLEKVEKSELDLSGVIEYMVLKYDALFQQKKLKVKAEVEKDCIVMADREYMEQAANNYIMNAFSHTGMGRCVEISLRKEEGKIFFAVYNDGERIAREEENKIWESYYQGEELRDHAGLGLYMVKTIISMHGGEYGYTNREKGVVFWFALPEA